MTDASQSIRLCLKDLTKRLRETAQLSACVQIFKRESKVTVVVSARMCSSVSCREIWAGNTRWPSPVTDQCTYAFCECYKTESEVWPWNVNWNRAKTPSTEVSLATSPHVMLNLLASMEDPVAVGGTGSSRLQQLLVKEQNRSLIWWYWSNVMFDSQQDWWSHFIGQWTVENECFVHIPEAKLRTWTVNWKAVKAMRWPLSHFGWFFIELLKVQINVRPELCKNTACFLSLSPHPYKTRFYIL